MNKPIKFSSTLPQFELPQPKPASAFIPEWYRKLPPTIGGDLTSKRCVPLLDSYSLGYIITLSCDLVFNDSSLVFSSNANGYEAVTEHDKKQLSGEPLGIDLHEQPFKFINPWHVKTPKGYSTIFTHPLNRDDLPFRTLTGVVDTDNHTLPVNFPFLMKKGFNGTIPAGTPIAQVFPFKRDDWSMDVDDTSGYDNESQSAYWFKPPMAYYKRHFWHKKRYQ